MPDNRPQLGLSDPINDLLQKIMGGQSVATGGPDIQQLINSMSGPKVSNMLSPLANPGEIGASNEGLNTNLQNTVQSIFGLVGQDAQNSLAYAQQAQARREVAEANARQKAMQEALLRAQKNAALGALGQNTPGTGILTNNNLGSVNTKVGNNGIGTFTDSSAVEPPLVFPKAKPPLMPPTQKPWWQKW